MRVKIIRGKALSVGSLQKFLNNSYTKSNDQANEIDGYTRDNELSDDKVQVYHNKKTSQAVVSHRGTKVDDPCEWLQNLAHYSGLYQYTPRYRHGKKVQELAERKYGACNLHTIGHSSGAVIAEKAGKNSRNIISVNRPVNIRDALFNTTGKNHYDIRSANDPTTIFQNFQQKTNPDVIIPSKTYDPIREHSINTLAELGDDTTIGKGIVRFKRKIYLPFHKITIL